MLIQCRQKYSYTSKNNIVRIQFSIENYIKDNFKLSKVMKKYLMNCIIMVIINCSSYSTSFKFFNYKFKYRGEKNEFSN